MTFARPEIKPSPTYRLVPRSQPARGLILDAKATQRQTLAEALDRHDRSLFSRCQNPKPDLWQVRHKKCVPQQHHFIKITHLVHTPATMLRHLLTIITSLSVYATGSLSDQIDLIRNPTQNAVYSPPYSPTIGNDAARLLVIGDVHGMLDELKDLLKKADFTTSRGDRVIFVGDLVNKGPESAGVVQYAMDMNATSVRGNHEDKVLRVWAGAEKARLRAESKGKDGDKAYKAFKKSLGSGKKDALKVAESLTLEQRLWLAAAPVALRLAELPGLGDVAVVHGGYVCS